MRCRRPEYPTWEDHSCDADLRVWLRTSAVEQTTGGGGPFGLLTLEFWLSGARVPAAREALAERYRRMRAGLLSALITSPS